VATIPSRWHDGTAPLRPYNTPSKQAALVFALYGLRRQMAGHIPGDTEATLTITGNDGQSLGRLELDADDVERLSKAVTGLMDADFGPMERADVNRLLAEHDNS
jgi:hypothetical protein